MAKQFTSQLPNLIHHLLEAIVDLGESATEKLDQLFIFGWGHVRGSQVSPRRKALTFALSGQIPRNRTIPRR